MIIALVPLNDVSTIMLVVRYAKLSWMVASIMKSLVILKAVYLNIL